MASTPFGDTVTLLEANYYTDDELARWLQLPQPLVDNKTPLELLATGRKDELLRAVKTMDEGVYI